MLGCSSANTHTALLCLPSTTQAIVDAGAVAYLAPLVINQDAKLKRQVSLKDFLSLASSMCRHAL